MRSKVWAWIGIITFSLLVWLFGIALLAHAATAPVKPQVFEKLPNSTTREPKCTTGKLEMPSLILLVTPDGQVVPLSFLSQRRVRC
jgi:hypothetical protein